MNLSRWIFTLFACTVSFGSLAQPDEVKFPAAAVKADLTYLYSTLQQSHYNLFAYVSKSKHDAAYSKMLRAVKQDSLSLLETTRLFQRFMAVSNVGHSEVDFPAASYIGYAQKGGTVFPLELAFEQGAAFIRKNYTGDTAIQVGDQVLRINKQPIRKVQEAIHPYLSAERTYFKNAKLEFWSFPRLYWSVFGQQEQFSIQLKSASGKTRTHQVAAIPVMDYETQRGGELLNSERSFTYFDDAAYLKPGPFSSPEPNGEAAFKAFIDSSFTDINMRQVKHLVLDLRNNSGGHNAFSDHLIAYVADKPFRWFSRFTIRTSEVLKAQTKRQNPGSEMDDYTRAILQHANGENFAYDQPLQQPVPEQQRFQGKVYVLINRHTYSMAAVSAALLQDYGFGQLVGEETGDVPTLYASQFSFALPQTGITVKVPKGYIVRPNGDEKLAGVIPDILVRDHLLDENDEILTYTLTKLIGVGKQ